MYWSSYILDLHKQGYDIDEIVGQLNLPLATPHYVKKVIDFYKRGYNKFIAVDRIIKNKPNSKPGTKRYLVKQYIDQVGLDNFWTEYKTNFSTGIAKKIGVHPSIVQEYVSTILRGRNNHPTYYKHKGSYHSVLIESGKMKPKARTKKVKDILELW
jgi:hypothetical protein